MLYFILGIIAGVLLNLSPIFLPECSVEIFPEWHAGIKLSEESKSETFINPIDHIKASSNKSLSGITLKPVIINSEIYILRGNGKLLKAFNIGENLISITRNGKYYIQYNKVGTNIELLNTNGDRFWRMDSREYPYISPNGKILLLMNGDHSRIRIADLNGNLTGAKMIHGRLCTSISFSYSTDYSAIGFLDGNFYLLDDKGEIIYSGFINNQIIKGITISTNGKYYAIHYGNINTDFVKLINLSNETASKLQLKGVHPSKTAMHITESGILTVIDYDRIIIFHDNEIKKIISIPRKSPGLSSIDFSNGTYSAGYTGIDERVHFFMFLENSSILFHKIMSKEKYIYIDVRENSILLTGSHNLYCYSFRIPGN